MEFDVLIKYTLFCIEICIKIYIAIHFMRRWCIIRGGSKKGLIKPSGKQVRTQALMTRTAHSHAKITPAPPTCVPVQGLCLRRRPHDVRTTSIWRQECGAGDTNLAREHSKTPTPPSCGRLCSDLTSMIKHACWTWGLRRRWYRDTWQALSACSREVSLIVYVHTR